MSKLKQEIIKLQEEAKKLHTKLKQTMTELKEAKDGVVSLVEKNSQAIVEQCKKGSEF